MRERESRRASDRERERQRERAGFHSIVVEAHGLRGEERLRRSGTVEEALSPARSLHPKWHSIPYYSALLSTTALLPK